MPIRRTKDFTRGFIYFFRGLKLIFTRLGLFKYAAMPLVVNVLLITGFFLSFNTLTFYLSDWIFTQGDAAWYWVAAKGIFALLMFIISLVAALFAFVSVGLLIAGPFNDLLSAAVERKLTGAVRDTEETLSATMFRTLKGEARKVAVFLTIQGALLALNLIPVAGSALYLVLNPLFIAYVMAYEFTGYALDRRGLAFAEKQGYLLNRSALTFGFGAAVGVTMMVPLLHFLLMPAAAAGGTLLIVEREAEETAPRARKE